MKTHRRSIAQAIAENFVIDMGAMGRPVGYKGPRFQPTEWCDCLTELESELLAACHAALPEIAAGPGGARVVAQLRRAIHRADGAL